jgi:N-acetyl-anhydromuramyl-L-alanine amidase AmpD
MAAKHGRVVKLLTLRLGEDADSASAFATEAAMAGLLGELPARVVATAQYALALPNLIHMKQKPAKNVYSRGGTAIDEIVLHGTESLRPQDASADYIASANDAGTSIHYWIGRDFGLLYAMVPEDKAAGHAGNPNQVAGVQDHNFRSIGIEMYQLDVSMFKGDKSKLDFTDWQYDTVAMLVYDICRRRGIKRKMVVGHGAINSVERGDPKNFDWDRFNRQLDRISQTLGGQLGSGFALN